VRLARYRSAVDGHVHVGLADADDITPIGSGDGLAGQALLLAEAMATAAPVGRSTPSEPLAGVTLLSPIPQPPSIRDFYAFEAHVATARRTRGLEMLPDWYELPVFYFTNPAAVLGPDDVVDPPDTAELDYELEVAAVVGVECSDLDPEDWLDVVAGFTVMNDWSARDLQRREMALGLGPSKAKDFATSLGPFLVTPDELLDADGLPAGAMTASVNGVEWSRGELRDLHHGWGALLAHASRDTTLRPGDVIGSGTVGTGCILELSAVHGSDRYPWLRPGDEVMLEVAGIGRLTNRIGSLPGGGPFPDGPAGEGSRHV
jgi:2-keto-4-pentenoate hydratase/2-oxohepta-3-ene-1,7-dioic acid hydratase in catechol pathway